MFDDYTMYLSKKESREQMEKDTIYVDSKGKIITVEAPQYGEIKLIIQNGKVIRSEVKTSEQYK